MYCYFDSVLMLCLPQGLISDCMKLALFLQARLIGQKQRYGVNDKSKLVTLFLRNVMYER